MLNVWENRNDVTDLEGRNLNSCRLGNQLSCNYFLCNLFILVMHFMQFADFVFFFMHLKCSLFTYIFNALMHFQLLSICSEIQFLIVLI